MFLGTSKIFEDNNSDIARGVRDFMFLKIT